MERRAFLRAVGLASVGLVLDPERLLWVPGAKRIFLPVYLPGTCGAIERTSFSFWRATQVGPSATFEDVMEACRRMCYSTPASARSSSRAAPTECFG